MECAQTMKQSNNTIVMLPPPAFIGHLIPFIELAKKIVKLEPSISVTIVIPHDDTMKTQKSLLQNLPPAITSIFLPPVQTDDLTGDLHVEMFLPIRIIRSLPSLRTTLALLRESLDTHVSAMVVDLFAPHAIELAREFGIPLYVFYVVAANELSLMMDLPRLDKSCASDDEFEDLPEPVMLPGNIVLLPEDFHDSMKERKNEVHKWVMDLCRNYLLADGIIVNSFLELESYAFEHLEQHIPGMPPVYPVGPLIRTGESDGMYSECVKWLEEQPPRSVLFVSFGSGGTLSKEQLIELAFGLLMSKQRFLWVLRTPHEKAEEGYFNNNNNQGICKNPLDFLPQGFLDAAKGKGLVVTSWIPQIQVLSHESTGGFVTHCGWNSILESTVHGVPLIAWPLCYEQKMSAVLVRDGFKTGMRVEKNENGLVKRDHFSKLAIELMEGEIGQKLRKRVEGLKSAAANATSKDGSSTKALAELVQKWIINS